MTTVLSRINNLFPSLTPSEAKAAEYCRLHPEAVINNSIHDVAKYAQVSVASVSRLANTLGFKDWKEMRLNLARDSSRNDNPIYATIDRGDSDSAVVQKTFNGNIASIHDTLGQISMDGIAMVLEALKTTDRVVFFGAGGSGFMAMDEALRFSHLDLAADAYTDEYNMMIQASKLRKGQLAFAFSYSGRSRAPVVALTEARRSQAMTVGIATGRGTPLEKVSDVYFSTAFSGTGHLTASLIARTALVSLMDSLYVLTAQYRRPEPILNRINQVIENNLRISEKTEVRSKK